MFEIFEDNEKLIIGTHKKTKKPQTKWIMGNFKILEGIQFLKTNVYVIHNPNTSICDDHNCLRFYLIFIKKETNKSLLHQYENDFFC